jgi:hypothetical protein
MEAYDWIYDVLVRSHTPRGVAGWLENWRTSRRARPTPPALAHVLERISGIADLDEGWDSYGALPPSEVALAKTRWLLNSLQDWLPAGIPDPGPFAMAPLSDGGIQLDWERPGLALELEVNPDGSLGYLLVEGEGEHREFLENDDAGLVEVIDLIRRAVISTPPA